jgi:hypothetical protein
MSHHSFNTITVNSWQEFKDRIARFGENWAFRGQTDSRWVLNNAIERTEFIQFYPSIEAEFVAEFQRGARNYLSRDETPQHLIEWLALMQHHGAPTRLLDLTRSPFIAAYFAFEHCHIRDGHHVGIWGINIAHLKERSLEILSTQFSEALEQSSNLINESLFESIFFNNDQSLVFPVEPFSMNRRYSLQQSMFVSTGNSRETFMSQLAFLGDDISKTVVRIEVPSSCKKVALRELQQMNLHRASLFPDLDGYALSLKLRYDNRKTPDELKRQYQDKQNDDSFNFMP